MVASAVLVGRKVFVGAGPLAVKVGALPPALQASAARISTNNTASTGFVFMIAVLSSRKNNVVAR